MRRLVDTQSDGRPHLDKQGTLLLLLLLLLYGGSGAGLQPASVAQGVAAALGLGLGLAQAQAQAQALLVLLQQQLLLLEPLQPGGPGLQLRVGPAIHVADEHPVALLLPLLALGRQGSVARDLDLDLGLHKINVAVESRDRSGGSLSQSQPSLIIVRTWLFGPLGYFFPGSMVVAIF